MGLKRKDAQASVLDRLFDDEPEVSQEPVRNRFLNVAQIKAAVIRDLENLLNTRRHILVPPPGCAEVNRSLFVYGLRDFSCLNPRSPAVRQQLRQDIQKTIALFEPRLRNVSVQLDAPVPNDRNLRFRISGILTVEPVAEPVSFDTLFDANRGQYMISR